MRYEIWSEGYAATGERGEAIKIGEAEAESFQEACNTLLRENGLYDSARLTYWGCRLFDNEADARKLFG